MTTNDARLSELWGVEGWKPYFKILQAPEVVEDVPDEEIEVLEPAYELEPQKAPGAPGTLAKRLAGQGWDVRVRASVVAVPAVRYVTAGDDHNKGDVRFAAHTLETFQVIGQKVASGKMLAVVAQWERKDGRGMKFVSATTYDPILGEKYRPTLLKPRPQRAAEKEDEIYPTPGLNQWLDAFTPKPAPKTKKKETA